MANERNSRPCRRTGCRRPAAASLSFRYETRQVWLLDLPVDPVHSLYDLCPDHADHLVVPRGWEYVDERSEPVAPSAAGRSAGASADSAGDGGHAAGVVRAEGGPVASGNRYEALVQDLPRVAAAFAAETEGRQEPTGPRRGATPVGDPEPRPGGGATRVGPPEPLHVAGGATRVRTPEPARASGGATRAGGRIPVPAPGGSTRAGAVPSGVGPGGATKASVVGGAPTGGGGAPHLGGGARPVRGVGGASALAASELTAPGLAAVPVPDSPPGDPGALGRAELPGQLALAVVDEHQPVGEAVVVSIGQATGRRRPPR